MVESSPWLLNAERHCSAKRNSCLAYFEWAIELACPGAPYAEIKTRMHYSECDLWPPALSAITGLALQSSDIQTQKTSNKSDDVASPVSLGFRPTLKTLLG